MEGFPLNFYDYLAKKPNGDIVSMQTYEGKVTLIVNTANQCQFTYQFEDLQKLYAKYKNQGFTVLGFPSNQFANQNPENSLQTASQCQLNYGVEFPMYEVVEVNGENTHPLFDHLKSAVEPRPINKASIEEAILIDTIQQLHPTYLIGNNIRWNFTKFLIDAQGNVIQRFEPGDSIIDIEKAIEQLLLVESAKS